MSSCTDAKVDYRLIKEACDKSLCLIEALLSEKKYEAAKTELTTNICKVTEDLTSIASCEEEKFQSMTGTNYLQYLAVLQERIKKVRMILRSFYS